jgi:hypothetical protein
MSNANEAAPRPGMRIGPAARVRLRGLQAAVCAGGMDLLMLPSELAVAALGGDPVEGVKTRMLHDLGLELAGTHRGTSQKASASRTVANRTVRQAGSILARLTVMAMQGTRFAPLVARRAYVVVSVGCAAYAAVAAYRDTTAVGFAALGNLQHKRVGDRA